MPVVSSQSPITTQFAQSALSRASAPPSASGLWTDLAEKVLTDVDDINQSFYIVLFTPKGSDPHRPTFGSNWWHWLDSPINFARPHIVREVVESITFWEPRVKLVSVVIEQTDQNNYATKELTVQWRFADGVGEQIFSSNVDMTGFMATLSGVVQ